MIAYKYDIEFLPDNGLAHKASDFNLIMTEYPVIPAAEKVFSSYEIPGRAGELIVDTKTKKNINLPVKLTLLVEQINQLEYRDYVRKITKWLNGPGWLKINDEHESRFRVLTIQVGASERITPIYGTIDVIFTIEPYEYVSSGFIAKPARDIRFNGYDLCKPIYYITGNTSGILTVNGINLVINTIENITIDTYLQLTFTTQNDEIKNQAITGDYEDLWLPPGDVTILATSGINVEVMPRWGWEL